MDNEFSDRVYLSSYSLDTRLFENFNFTVFDAAPIRSVFLLTTDQGYKILKKINYDIGEVIFLYNALEKIKIKFPYIINFKESRNKEPYCVFDGDTYVVFDMVEGRECIFENPIDIKAAAQGLAKYHSAAKNIRIQHKNRNISGKLSTKYRQCIKELESYKRVANMHVNKNEFDSLYLQNCDYYIDYIKKALEQIAASDYNEVSGTGNVLCHHDLAHHNIMIGNDNNVYLLDFDYSVIDLPEHDLSNLLTKAAKKSNWNIKAVDNIMDGYDKIEQTGKSFKNIVLAYLMFPVDFYDISKAYYMRTKIWDESDFIEKLNRKAGYKNQREEFIEYYKTLCVK